MKTLEDAVEKCKQDKTIVVGKVRLSDGGERVLMILPVVKRDGLTEKMGTVEISLELNDAESLVEKLRVAINADTTGWAEEAENE